MKRRFAIALAMVLVFGFAVVTNGLAARDTTEVIIGMSQEPDSLNSMLSDMSATTQVVTLLQGDLLGRDSDWKLYTDFATSIPTIENKQWKILPGEKMEVTWKLRKGLRWQDGTEITSADYKFTYDVIMNDEIGVPSREISERIEDFKIVDKYTFVLRFKELYHLANLGLDYAPIPKHVFEPILKKGPKAFTECDFSKQPMSSGPFIMKEWVPGSHMILVANPKYSAGRKPKVKTIVFKFITNTNTMMANLLAGAVDTTTTIDLSFDQGVALQKMITEQKRATEYRVDFTPALVWEHIDFNLDNPWFKDVRVRQAMVYGLNRQEMVNALFEGKQPVSHSYLPPKHYGYTPNVKQYNYDPKMATKLLEEAGWKMGPKGVLVNGKGEEFSIVIHTTAGNAVREKVEQILKAQWKQIGIELTIQNQPSTVLFGETGPKRLYKDLMMYAWVSPPTTNPYGLWDSSQIPTAENAYAGQNRPGWRSAKSDELCRAILKELSEPKRVKLFAEHQILWAQELPSIPLYFRADVSATNNSLLNVKPTGNTTGITWNANTWVWAK